MCWLDLGEGDEGQIWAQARGPEGRGQVHLDNHTTPRRQIILITFLTVDRWRLLRLETSRNHHRPSREGALPRPAGFRLERRPPILAKDQTRPAPPDQVNQGGLTAPPDRLRLR
jgi:hypothetical protein